MLAAELPPLSYLASLCCKASICFGRSDSFVSGLVFDTLLISARLTLAGLGLLSLAGLGLHSLVGRAGEDSIF